MNVLDGRRQAASMVRATIIEMDGSRLLLKSTLPHFQFCWAAISGLDGQSR
jgi:hypothetical protein